LQRTFVEEEGVTCLANLDPDDPLEPLQAGSSSYRLALGPRPRLHLIRFHGVLAPNAGLRAAVVPGPPEKPGYDAAHHAHRRGSRRFFRRPDPQRQERLCNGADNPARLTLACRGSACVGVRQFGVLQGANRH